MSNVLKSLLGQIARPTTTSLYGQNDMLAQALIQLFTQGNGAVPAQGSQNTNNLIPTSLNPVAYSTENMYLMSQQASNHQSGILPQQQTNGLKIGVQKTPAWIKREQFMMTAQANEYFQDHQALSADVDSITQSTEGLSLQGTQHVASAFPAHHQYYRYHQLTAPSGTALPGVMSGYNQKKLGSAIDPLTAMNMEDLINQGKPLNPNVSEFQYQGPAYQTAEDFEEELGNEDYCDLSIKKPRRIFANKEDQTRYIESFKTKYKTEICKNWELTGFCAFEESCSFAHGQNELNTKQHIPKNYKTKLCKRFHEELYCPYGPRCQFKHQGDDVPNKNDYHNLSGAGNLTQTQQAKTNSNQESLKAASMGIEPLDMKIVSEVIQKGLKSQRSFKSQTSDCAEKDFSHESQETQSQTSSDKPLENNDEITNSEFSQVQGAPTLGNTLSGLGFNRKRLQIFEKITLTKSSKRKGGKKKDTSTVAAPLTQSGNANSL
eukprot:403355607